MRTPAATAAVVWGLACVLLAGDAARAGSHATLREESRLLVVEMETSSGSMEDPSQETRHLEAWTKRTAPVLAHHKTHLEAELSRVAGVLKLPVVPYNKDTRASPVLWEEKVDAGDIPRHEKAGGGPCTLRFRLWPGERVDVLISFSRLPDATQRQQLKKSLEDVVRSHPYMQPGIPAP